MKNKKSFIIAAVMLGLGSGGLLLGYGSTSYLQASIVEEPENIQFIESLHGSADTQEIVLERRINEETTSIAPDSPDFLNTFNMFKYLSSENAIFAGYEHNIQGEPSRIHVEYMPEILSFISRVAPSEFVYDKMPMWPADNVATYGNILAYLFPQEPNPMLFAKGLPIVPADAKSHSYMSRAEVVRVIDDLFIPEGQDPYLMLSSAGFIDDVNKWKSEDKDGFLLVEAIRVVLSIREVIERENITASKAQYETQLVELEDEAVLLGEESLEVMLTAFVNELRDKQGAPKVPPRLRKRLQDFFSIRYGMPLSSEMVSEARNIFYEEMNRKSGAIYELPAVMTAGSCDVEMFRKTYMGAVAVTGPLGSMIICEKVMIQLPANAFLLNMYSLPKITSFQDPDVAGRTVVRTDVLRSYKNTLVLTADGEQRVRIVLRPEGVEKMLGEKYEMAIKEQDGDDILSKTGTYEEEGAVLRPHLRNFSGDNLIIFDEKAI